MPVGPQSYGLLCTTETTGCMYYVFLAEHPTWCMDWRAVVDIHLLPSSPLSSSSAAGCLHVSAHPVVFYSRPFSAFVKAHPRVTSYSISQNHLPAPNSPCFTSHLQLQDCYTESLRVPTPARHLLGRQRPSSTWASGAQTFFPSGVSPKESCEVTATSFPCYPIGWAVKLN